MRAFAIILVLFGLLVPVASTIPTGNSSLVPSLNGAARVSPKVCFFARSGHGWYGVAEYEFVTSAGGLRPPPDSL